jgi:hypothetical protein
MSYHYCLGVCAKQLKQGRKGSEYKRKEKKRKENQNQPKKATSTPSLEETSGWHSQSLIYQASLLLILA